MPRFALYRQTKRRKDWVLVDWPVHAADARAALADYAADRLARGLGACRRIRVVGPIEQLMPPPAARLAFGPTRPRKAGEAKPSAPLIVMRMHRARSGRPP